MSSKVKGMKIVRRRVDKHRPINPRMPHEVGTRTGDVEGGIFYFTDSNTGERGSEFLNPYDGAKYLSRASKHVGVLRPKVVTHEATIPESYKLPRWWHGETTSRIMVIGKTGVGKSTVLNHLLFDAPVGDKIPFTGIYYITDSTEALARTTAENVGRCRESFERQHPPSTVEGKIARNPADPNFKFRVLSGSQFAKVSWRSIRPHPESVDTFNHTVFVFDDGERTKAVIRELQFMMKESRSKGITLVYVNQDPYTKHVGEEERSQADVVMMLGRVDRERYMVKRYLSKYIRNEGIQEEILDGLSDSKMLVLRDGDYCIYDVKKSV